MSKIDFWNTRPVYRSLAKHSMGRKILSTLGSRYFKWQSNDFSLYLDLKDRWGVSKYILKFDEYDHELGEVVKRILPPHSICLDIGANIGYWSNFLASACNTKKIYSFEPEPNNLSLLKANNELNNNSACIQVFPVAVSDKKTQLKLHLSKDNAGDHQLYATSEERNTITVDVETIDSLLPELVVDFVKIDIQGFESFAFRGMDSLMKRSPNLVILMEYWPEGIKRAGGNPQELLEFFEQHGFFCYAFNEKARVLNSSRFSELDSLIPAGHHVDLVLAKSTLPAEKLHS